MATSFNVNAHDLQYILRQIKIAEDHASGKTLLQSIMDAYGTTAANAAQLPAGLRTVDGSFNSLVAGQENYGTANMIFPRLLTPVFTNEMDEAPFPLGPPPAPVATNTNYANPGNVVDSDPRIISNLVNNMTASNPAAVMAALQFSVFSETILPSAVAGHAQAIALAQAGVVAASDAGSTTVERDAATVILNAALAAAGIEVGPEGGLVIPNLSPDIGLSPGFNAWMTFFGQFFDHGLDLVTKGGNGTVFIPLAADDPLIAGADGIVGTADDLPARLRFMALTRVNTSIDLNGDGDTLDAGETGNTSGQNTTTSFVDQNQTYTSNASHQVFLREYATVGGKTVSTGNLLDGKTSTGSHDGAIGNWADVKASALQFLGIALSDFDVGSVPWLRTDAYGRFIPDPVTGFAQVIIGVGADGKPNTADDIVVSGTPAAPVDLDTAGALGTGHAFLVDNARHAAPGFIDTNRNGVQDGGELLQVADFDMLDANGDGLSNAADVAHLTLIGRPLTDANGDSVIDALDLADVNLDGVINATDLVANDQNALTYDDENLNSHFITGDGRGNENIGLTTVHSIFHSEHNRLVGANKATLIENGNAAFLNEWLLVDVDPTLTALQVQALNPASLVWDGERLFQAARFATEMQYQHMVFEEFARRVQPMVDPFIFNNSPDVDPSIVAEFAHTVYRFGHSMLTDTVDRLTNDLEFVNGEASQATLIAAFLNPQMYVASGATLAEANANIIRGLTRDVGNEIDEFIVPALQSNLLGLPLDLPALNMARGRETGIPSLNETRAQLYNDFGIVDLKPYASWKDFGLAIKNPMSVINFIAAYGTHATILAETTLAGKRAAAYELVVGTDVNGGGVAADRLAFLNATGAWANGAGELGGLNNVDLWVGGLAEKKNEFGGMLGSTFNFIFEFQMENLQNGDRLYYLTRTQGLNMLNNLEPNTFTDMVMRNTDLGNIYSTHLNAALFTTPDHIIELDRGIAQQDYDAGLGIDPLWDGLDPVTEAILGPKVVRDYTGSTTVTVGTVDHDVGGYLRVQGGEHYVLGGTEGNDTLMSDSGIDALWGDGGDDYLNGGTESDDVFGGEGDDIIEDPFGDDVLRGNQGNDVITEARGADLVFGDEGNDYIILGQDASEAFGGEGDDFILGGNGKDFLLGNEGNDWIEGGGGFETIAGENSELFFNSTIIGHDVLFGQADETDYDAESGDDIMGSGASVYRYEGMFGFDWAMAKGDFTTTGVNFDFQIPIFTTIPNDVLKDRFDQVEAGSGWAYDDYLQGDDRGHKGGGSSAPDSVPTELFAEHLLTQEGINRITGLNEWFGSTGGVMDTTDARYTLFGGLSPVPGSTAASTYRDGNILIGGDGDDILRGRGGFDLLDGDAYLNVRIKIVVGGITYSAESMSTDTAAMGEYAGKVFNTNADGTPNFASVAFGGRSLNSLMLDRTINPGNMSIVREILTDSTPSNNIDTALYQGTREEYDIEGITQVVNLNGTDPDTLAYTGSATDLNGDGFISVRDRDTGAIGATVWRIIDGVATQVALSSSRGLLTDDHDLLKNVEQLQFADQMVTISGNNALATGTVTISDATPFDGRVTPYVGQVLTATLSNFADLDGIPLDGNGLPVGLNFIWQTTEVGSNSGWSDIQTSQNYTVRSVDPGHILRAVAVFKDANGHNERILSAATDNPTAVFRVAENSVNGAMVGLQIPFNVDYDSQSINGAPPPDVDINTLYHEIDPANDSGGRFTVVANGVDFNGKPRYSLVVADGGPMMLNYEAPVHTPANQSFQFVDNQYQVVINTYSDTPANGGILVAVRQFTVLLDDVTGEPVNIAPVLDLASPMIVARTYADNFDGVFLTPSAANNSTGATAWTSSWIESNDGANNIRNGQVQIDTGPIVFGVLVPINNDMRFINGDGAGMTRAVDLSGATSATLSFDFDKNGIDVGESVTVQFAADGVNFQTIQTITNTLNTALDGDANGSVTNLALPGTLGASSAIRFVASNISTAGEDIRINNVAINFTAQAAGTAGNNFATTYTENAAAVAIAATPTITDADNLQMMAATVRLTNAQAGDVLSTVGALPSGITASFGPAVAGQITMYLNGPASLAAFQTAIAAVRFGNPADNNPVSGVRTITVSVNDGEVESNIATASVTVVAVNDVFTAGSDRIVTNIANVANGIIVPEWILLANDSDPDGPAAVADITAISGALSLTASLATTPGSVTISDTGAGSGGTFNYTATFGAQSATGAVAVLRDTTGNIDGASGDDILVGDGANSIFDGGLGNDFVLAGAGNDTINWDAGDGRDIIDGGVGGTDTFVLNGDNSTANPETFRVYARADALAAGVAVVAAGSDIVITRSAGSGPAVVVAELDEIEEIIINTGGGNDLVQAIGNFNPTNLNFNTIHVNGGAGNTTVDISGLTSSHRVVLTGNGGDDRIIGGLRAQDQVHVGTVSDDDGWEIEIEEETNHIWATKRANVMSGTNEEDVFHFTSNKSTRGDVIVNFEPGDKIDLSAMDAVGGMRGNQSFTLVSGGLHEKGDLMVTEQMRADGVYTIISGNNYGDERADFKIAIKGSHDLDSSDFCL